MMRIMLLFSMICAAVSVFGKIPPGARPVTPEEREAILARSGGMLPPPDGGGAFVAAVACGRVDASNMVVRCAERAATLLRLAVEVHGAPSPAPGSAFTAAKGLLSKEVAAVLLVTDEKDAPALAVYPEEGVCVLNLNPLSTPDTGLAAKRIEKEFWRGFGFLLGAYATPLPGDALQPVRSLAELDAMKGCCLSPARFQNIFKTAKQLGIRSTRPVPYRVAVREGWAPAPTNDVQRAIWEDVKKKK